MFKLALKLGAGVLGVMAVGAVGLAVFAPIDPVAWSPPDASESPINCERARLLQARVFTSGLPGTPDGLDFGPDGTLYAALSTGVIVAIDAKTGSFTQIGEAKGARLTGLAASKNGTVYAADEIGGSVYAFTRALSPRLTATPISGQKILAQLNGEALQWTNDVALAPNGMLFVTTSSQRRNLHQFYHEVLEHRGSGLLIGFNLQTGQAKALQTALEMTNGLAFSHDGRSVLVAESSAYRVSRFGVEGTNQGEVVSNLPGFLGNIRRSDQTGRYWLTLLSPRNALVDQLADKPAARRLMAWLPANVRPKPSPFHCLISLSQSETAMQAKAFRVEGPSDMPSLSTAIERAGRLYITPAGLGGVERGVIYVIDQLQEINP